MAEVVHFTWDMPQPENLQRAEVLQKARSGSTSGQPLAVCRFSGWGICEVNCKWEQQSRAHLAGGRVGSVARSEAVELVAEAQGQSWGRQALLHRLGVVLVNQVAKPTLHQVQLLPLHGKPKRSGTTLRANAVKAIHPHPLW